MESRNSTIFVSRSVGPTKNMPEPTGDEDVIAVHKFETEPAEVGVDYALTMNLGNFNSAKISVSVRVPCYKEEIDEAYEFAQGWVETRVSKERDMIAASRDGKANPL